jgi:hypothetical protein
MPETAARAEVRRAEVVSVKTDGQRTECVLREASPVLVSKFLRGWILPGEIVELVLPPEAAGVGIEILVHKGPNSKSKDVYQAPIGYVTKPKEDRRGQFYLLAEVRGSGLGFTSMRLNCEVVRDYFYVAWRASPGKGEQPNFYEILRTSPAASLAELRLAYRLRELELKNASGRQVEFATAERAFNILAEPELRACYDALLRDSETPVLFPYGGFGSLLVEGERSRDGKTFFARRILSFSPDRRERRFKVRLRRFHFCAGHAVYRDPRRRLELVVDQAAMPLLWDPTWNQWKRLLGAKVDVQATFLQTGVYRMRGGKWDLASWEKALPSRISVTMPADINEQIEAARHTHHLFGQYADFFDRLRVCIQREPVAKSEIERLCREVGITGDFDVAQITWQADYEGFYYLQLLKRARTMYLFRDEYIFELERAIVVETPQLGRATYLFAEPRSLNGFLALYASATRGDIRHNRSNVAERLGFLGRVVHGMTQRAWLKELRWRLGEPTGCPDR